MRVETSIVHRLSKSPNGTFNFGANGLSAGEALELLVVLRRLELYQSRGIDSDIVETAMRTLARLEMS